MSALAISDLTPRAGLLYAYAAEFCDPATGAIGSYGIVAACADCAGLAREFATHYGQPSVWEGSGIDFGELIHWAHSLG